MKFIVLFHVRSKEQSLKIYAGRICSLLNLLTIAKIYFTKQYVKDAKGRQIKTLI